LVNHQPAPRVKGFGETRRLEPKAKPEGAGREVTRNHTGRRDRWKDTEGKPKVPNTRSAEGREIRGDSNIRRRHSRKMQKPGRPGDSSAGATRRASHGATRGLRDGCAEGCEIRGNSKIHRRQGRKMQKPGKLGDSSRGTTGNAEPRGDPKLERRTCRRMRNSRRLEDPSPAKPEDAGCGATRSHIGKHVCIAE